MFVTTLNAEKLWQSLINWAKFDLQITSKSSKFIFICLSECLKQHFETWHLAAFSFRFYLLWQGRQAETCSQQKYYTCPYCQGLIQLFEASRSRQTFPAGPSSDWRFFAGWHQVAMTTDSPHPPPFLSSDFLSGHTGLTQTASSAAAQVQRAGGGEGGDCVSSL